MRNWHENFSIISKLKVAEHQSDALAARLFFEQVFGAVNFHPPGISQKAIICIKKINAPPFKNSRLTNSAFEWEKSVRSEVEKLYRRAFRPIRGTVPAQAESIVFEDKAEMLACLARDWRGGVLTEHWWWRGIFPNLFRAQTVAEIWLDSAEFAPAALQILSKTDAAKEFVQKLQPHETFRLLKKIIRIFGLTKLEAVLAEPIEEKEKSVVEKFIKTFEKGDFLSGKKMFFTSLLPELKVADLNFERRCLLETALLLARSPRFTRSPEFAARVKFNRLKSELRKTVAGGKPERIFDEDQPFGKSAASPEKTSQRSQKKNENQINRLEPAMTGKTFFRGKKNKRNKKPLKIPRADLKKLPNLAESPSTETKKFRKHKKSTNIEFAAVQLKKVVKKTERKSELKNEEFINPSAIETAVEKYFEEFETPIGHSFQTRFGGVFYLLNLGLYLGLYRDFTESLETEIDLNIWDFVALLGLEFLGEGIKTDAVWGFLSRMAERENDREFGREFDKFQDWRVPPEWLKTFSGNMEWFWAVKGKRLVIRHSGEFNVIDVCLRGEAENQIRNELESYQKYFSKTVKAGKKDLPQIRSKKWLKNLAEYLKMRLFRALNLQNSDDLNAVLFERGAMVSVSANHLDITYSLADLPIEVRLAGIDRDPGWIPAAGKFVYFHFV